MKDSGSKLRAQECSDLLMKLSAYLDGDLEECCCQELEAQLEDSPCQALKLEQMRLVAQACREMRDSPDTPEMSQAFRSRLRSAIDELES